MYSQLRVFFLKCAFMSTRTPDQPVVSTAGAWIQVCLVPTVQGPVPWPPFLRRAPKAPLKADLAFTLQRPALEIVQPRSAVSRAYARVYRQVPFIARGVPGCGLFAVNAAGRARWADWPPIISDDTFARLHFSAAERHAVPGRYRWPLVEGWRALVRVRRRQNIGVTEIRRLYPALAANDEKPPLGAAGKLRLALNDPAGFAVYAGVALATRLGTDKGWSRGR